MRELGKRAARLLAVFAFVLALAGCHAGRDNGERVRDLEFSVAAQGEIPEELARMIGEKQGEPFKLTYGDGGNLYIAIGYGAQESGGYSIRVHELYLSENSVCVDTELVGPESGEMGSGQSFPYIVIRTEYLEQPVVFR